VGKGHLNMLHNSTANNATILL